MDSDDEPMHGGAVIANIEACADDPPLFAAAVDPAAAAAAPPPLSSAPPLPAPPSEHRYLTGLADVRELAAAGAGTGAGAGELVQLPLVAVHIETLPLPGETSPLQLRAALLASQLAARPGAAPRAVVVAFTHGLGARAGVSFSEVGVLVEVRAMGAAEAAGPAAGGGGGARGGGPATMLALALRRCRVVRVLARDECEAQLLDGGEGGAPGFGPLPQPSARQTHFPRAAWCQFEDRALAERVWRGFVARGLAAESASAPGAGWRGAAPDALALSYWASRSVPASGPARLQLLCAASAAARLRLLLDLLAPGGLTDLECLGCRQRVADIGESFALPHAGGALHSFANVVQTFKIATLRRLLPGACRARRVQEASAERTWFEGYAWTPLSCATCGSHLGWRYDYVGALALSDRVRVLIMTERTRARLEWGISRLGGLAAHVPFLGAEGLDAVAEAGAGERGEVAGEAAGEEGGDLGGGGSNEEEEEEGAERNSAAEGAAGGADGALDAAAEEASAPPSPDAAATANALHAFVMRVAGDGNSSRSDISFELLARAVAPPPAGLPRSFVGLASGACVGFKQRAAGRETLLARAPRPWMRRTLAPGLSEAARFRAQLPRL